MQRYIQNAFVHASKALQPAGKAMCLNVHRSVFLPEGYAQKVIGKYSVCERSFFVLCFVPCCQDNSLEDCYSSRQLQQCHSTRQCMHNHVLLTPPLETACALCRNPGQQYSMGDTFCSQCETVSEWVISRLEKDTVLHCMWGVQGLFCLSQFWQQLPYCLLIWTTVGHKVVYSNCV